jgi:mycothiol system anti-sigma-R factor
LKERCRDAIEQAYLYLDGEVLSSDERRRIEIHLQECHPCFERFGLEQEVTEIVTRLRGRAECPQSLRIRITTLFREM